MSSHSFLSISPTLAPDPAWNVVMAPSRRPNEKYLPRFLSWVYFVNPMEEGDAAHIAGQESLDLSLELFDA